MGTSGTAAFKARLEVVLGRAVFSLPEKFTPPTISTSIPEVDTACGGLLRGAITEIAGPVSSGRTTLLHSLLAEATGRGEVCALVDLSDAFDPASAAAAGMELQRLLWVRCAAQKNTALSVTDLLLQNGGWGVIVLDLGDMDPQQARRIPLNAWYRFRLAVENKPTVFVVIGKEPYAGACSALVLEAGNLQARWSSTLLDSAVFHADRRKPPGRAAACFRATASAIPRQDASCLPASL